MPDIKINITNKRAAVEGSPVIVCGNSDYVLQLTFDEEWSAATYKTARFVYVQNGQVLHEDRDFTGETVEVPVLSNTSQVKVGVFAGELYTSTPAVIPCKASILCGSGAPAVPTPEEDARIMELLNLAIEQQAQAEAAAEAAEAAKDAAEAIVAEEIVKFAPVIAQTAAGSPVLLQDSSDNKLVGFSVRRKNWLKNTAASQNIDGVDVAMNEDGSITLNGTATANATLVLSNVFLKKGSYILNGYPKGVDGNTFIHWVNDTILNYTDRGEGASFTISEDMNCRYAFRVFSGQTVSLTFYPMIRLAEVEDDTFAPYIEDDDSIEVKSCGKNLLPNDLETQSTSGYDITVNSDGSITVDGTSTSYVIPSIATNLTLPKGDYILSGCPSGGSSDSYVLDFGPNTTGDMGSGKAFTLTEVTTFENIRLRLAPGTVDGVTFYPMIRPAEVEDDTYEPYKESTAVVTLADQTQAQQLRTFKPVTYITASDGAVMEVEYAADTKKYIDNKIAEICAAMLNS